jgi:phosphate uptake regulator
LGRRLRSIEFQIGEAMEALTTRDSGRAQRIIAPKAMYAQMSRWRLRRISASALLTSMEKICRRGQCAGSAHLLFCTKNLERMGDHATNIAEISLQKIAGIDNLAAGRAAAVTIVPISIQTPRLL